MENEYKLYGSFIVETSTGEVVTSPSVLVSADKEYMLGSHSKMYRVGFLAKTERVDFDCLYTAVSLDSFGLDVKDKYLILKELSCGDLTRRLNLTSPCNVYRGNCELLSILLAGDIDELRKCLVFLRQKHIIVAECEQKSRRGLRPVYIQEAERKQLLEGAEYNEYRLQMGYFVSVISGSSGVEPIAIVENRYGALSRHIFTDICFADIDLSKNCI